jgi:hypothetical protein
LPLQSDGQSTQSSPLPASQTPLPHTAPLAAMQSFEQPLQSSSPSQTPSLSHTGQLEQPA